MIAIVDDEKNLRTTLEYAFNREGFRVTTYADGEAAWQAVSREMPELLILDIIMPRMDGLELCRRVRTISETVPIIFLTSKDDEFDRVLGLGIGADDYLCKPFSTRELIARVRVLLRRVELLERYRTGADRGGSENADESPPVVVGELELDSAAYTARYHGAPLELTVTEFRILAALAAHPGQVLTRETLLAHAYPDDVYVADRAIDSHIKRLRKKIVNGDRPDAIDTVYGVGYRLRSDGRTP